jgi:hypothetical protein
MDKLEIPDVVAVGCVCLLVGFVIGLVVFNYAFPCPADMMPEYLSNHG